MVLQPQNGAGQSEIERNDVIALFEGGAMGFAVGAYNLELEFGLHQRS